MKNNLSKIMLLLKDVCCYFKRSDEWRVLHMQALLTFQKMINQVV